MAEVQPLDFDSLEFLSPLPDYLEIKCPICMDFQHNDPHLVTCCGHHICKTCVDKISGPCPFCKSKTFQKVSDKFFQRAVNSLQVKCITSDKGCDWTGELRQLYKHISREGTCEHFTLPCKNNCNSKIRRSNLNKHEQNSCPKRPATCSHCKKYKSTWENVANVHSRSCPSYPIPCPNGCGKTTKRSESSDHCSKDCPFRKIKCNFAVAGCKWSERAELLSGHMEESYKDHMTMTSLQILQQLQKQSKEISTLSQRVQKLESKINSSLLSPKTEETSRAEATSSRIKMVSSKGTEMFVSLPDVAGPKKCLQFEIKKWLDKKQNHVQLSKAFSFAGYKMQMSIYSCGIDSVRGTHISVYVRILSSPHDRQLDWPFRGKLIVRLINPTGMNHWFGVIIFDETVPDGYCIADGFPYGIEKFIGFQDALTYLTPLKQSLLFDLPQIG